MGIRGQANSCNHGDVGRLAIAMDGGEQDIYLVIGQVRQLLLLQAGREGGHVPAGWGGRFPLVGGAR